MQPIALTQKLTRCCVSAGEVSGDQHLARVVTLLRRSNPEIEFRGMAGGACRAAGVELTVDADQAARIMGFQELRGGVGKTLRSLATMKKLLAEWRPELLILVDYPDFNFRLARYASRLGIKTLYYIPPKAWAWRSGRVRFLDKYVDHIAAIFPFEEEFFKRRGMRRVTYVGHPSTEQCREHEGTVPFEPSTVGFDSKRQTLLVMPGSRPGELDRHLPIVTGALRRLHDRLPDLQVMFVAAPSVDPRALEARVRPEIPERMRVAVVQSARNGDNIPSLLRSADVGFLKSGTCNLEAALCGLPFISFFKLSAPTAAIVRAFVKVKEYSPVNVVRSGTVLELMQDDATPERVADELQKLLTDVEARRAVCARMSEAAAQLTAPDGDRVVTASPSERVARLVPKVMAGRVRRDMYGRVLRYLKPYRSQFFLALVTMVVFGASDGVIPFIVQRILDGIFARRDETLLFALPIIIFIFSIIRGLADFGQQYLMSKIGHEVIRDMRGEMDRRILKLDPGYFVRNSVGDVLSRLTSDVLLVRTLLTETVAAMIRDIIRLAALIIAALYLDPLLAVIAVIVVPVGFLPIYHLSRRMRRLSRVGQDAIGNLSTIVQEGMQGNRVVKAFGREEFEAERFSIENNRLAKTFIRSELVRALTGPINEVLASVAIGGVILYGGYSVIAGTRSQGAFIAFLIAVFLLYDPFKKLSRVSGVVQQGLTGAERIFELLDTESDITSPENPEPLPAASSIVFDRVSFSYREGGTEVVRDVSLSIGEGEKVAIVGLSGSGKSTLVDFIPRFMDPVRGRVLIGGTDVRKLSLEALRSRVTIVSQHTFLFNTTIAANIAYGRAGATTAEIEAAARAAAAHDFIARLPRGYETLIGEGGYSLSGGERQRIAIARAMLKNAPIVILDEATASLDNRSEREVQQALEKLEDGRTSIIIAHRLSTIQGADRIVVMKEGTIVEEGTHDELLRLNREYARLYALQFRAEESAMESVIQ